jgi:hypothetical protein
MLQEIRSFFTVTILKRHRNLLTEHIDHLRATFTVAH